MAKDRTESIIGTYEQHPIAATLMPGGMDEPEFTAFCEDVEQRGILMPVTLYEGKVLDGWHRYRAGQKTGTPFKTIEYTGKDPAGYIASVNVLRRKLSSLQRALVGARLHRDHNLTQRDVCRKLGISNEVVTLVLKTLDSKNAKLIKRIEDDSDFTRGMLKEELADAGLLRAPAKQDETPTGPNSVFNQAPRTGKEGQVTLGPGAYANQPTGDTDGSDGDEDIDDDDILVGKGKSASDKAVKKPKVTAAQLLADGFKALMGDEKSTFIRMIWPEARVLLALMPDLTVASSEPKESLEQKVATAAGKVNLPVKPTPKKTAKK
jgi:hypothetical protein